MNRGLLLLVLVFGCAPQQPPPSGYYPRPAYSNAPRPGEYDPLAGGNAGGATYGVGYTDPYAPYGGAPGGPVERQLSFNGRTATDEDLRTLAQIEQLYGRPTPSGDYWYDATSGAAGRWGGPALGFLPAGLALGGPLPPNASGGGDGRLTGVFVNGRELHPVDVQVLERSYGPVPRGRLWIDARGDIGVAGQGAVVNLTVIARQRRGGLESYYRSDGRGTNAFLGGGCVSVATTTDAGYARTTYAFNSAGC